MRADDASAGTAEPSPRRRRRWPWVIASILVGLVAVVAATYGAARFYFWPRLDAMATERIVGLERELGTRIRWDALATDWQGLRPTFDLTGLVIGRGDDAVRVERIAGTLSLSALLHGQWGLDSLKIDRPAVTLRRHGDGWALAALPRRAGSDTDPGASADPATAPSTALSRWLAMIPDLRIGDGRLTVVADLADSPDGGGSADAEPTRELQLGGIDLVVQSRGRLQDLTVGIAEPGPLGGRLDLRADVLRPPRAEAGDWQHWQGSVRLQGRDVDPAVALALARQWGVFAPGGDALALVSTIRGRVDPDLRIAIRDGAAVDGRLGLRSTALTLPVTPGATEVTELGRFETDLRWRREDGVVGPPRASSTATATATSTSNATAATATAAVTSNAAPPSTAATATAADGQSGVAATTGATRPSRWQVEVPVLVARSRDGTAEDRLVALAAGPHGVVAAVDAAPWRLVRLDADIAEAALAAPMRWARAWLPGLDRIIEFGGRARAANLHWQDDGQWRITGAVDRAAFAMSPSAFELAHPLEPRIPGLRQLDLQLEATQDGGQAAVTVSKGVEGRLTFGGIFAEPEIPITELAGTIGWRILGWPTPTHPLRLALDIDAKRFANADAAGRATARYVADATGHDGQIAVDATLERAQARRVYRYLPLHLPVEARDWVRQAFESGQLDQVSARAAGRMKAFPFQRADEVDQGSFRLEGRFRDVLLRFAPEWPTLQQVAGRVEIDRARLRLNGERGDVGKSRLEGVTVAIDDLTHPHLKVQGRLRGEATDLVRFVNASPLVDTPVGAVTRPLRAEGPIRGALGLDWLLHEPHSHPKVVGQLDLEGTELEFEPGQPVLTGSRGRLDFTDDSIDFRGLTATMLGSPLEASGRSIPGEGVLIETSGRLSAETLRRLTDNPLTRQLDGAARFSCTTRITDAGRRIEIRSDLVGLASRLPMPLAKPAAEAWPLRFDWWADPAAPKTLERMEGSIGSDLRFVAERSAAAPGRPLLITRAAVARGQPPVMPRRGLAVFATVDRLDGDAWQAVFADAPAANGQAPDGQSSPPAPAGTGTAAAGSAPVGTAPAGTAPAGTTTATPAPIPASRPAASAASSGNGLFADDFEPEPVRFGLIADDVRYGARRYRDVRLDGQRDGRFWQTRLQARGLSGTVGYEQGGAAGPGGRIVGRFARLALPPVIEGESPSVSSSSDSRMPALDITADDFAVGDARFGRLDLKATNVANPPAWRLDRLALTSPAATFEAVGRFRHATELDYRLAIADAGALLDQIGLKDVVRGGSGSMSGRIGWRSLPSNLDIASLAGELSLDIRNGQFLKADPGAAKLIGVLNLQALPKWLTLDFTDLFARGFAFQELTGEVTIDRGIARTDTVAMKGLEAVVQMKGVADLKQQTQDLQVTVLPHLDGSLAALAYAAIINPAVGLGAFVAQSLLGRQLSKVFAYDFEVTGPWADPRVVEKKPKREASKPDWRYGE